MCRYQQLILGIEYNMQLWLVANFIVQVYLSNDPLAFTRVPLYCHLHSGDPNNTCNDS